jgi:hypothetical protein
MKKSTGKMKWVRVSYTQGGRRREVEVEVPASGEPEEELVAEAAHFVQTLADNAQLAETPGALSPGATHQIETLPDGTKRLKRRRFTVG